MILWSHQQRGIDAVLAASERRLCLTSPTGGGKTVVIQELVKHTLAQRGRAVIYTNRKLLVEQLSESCLDAGMFHGVRASGYEDDREHPFQISSIQTETSRVLKRATWELHPASLAVLDESHLHTGENAREIINRHAAAGCKVLGITATPLGLAGIYDRLIVAGTTSELRACGALVPAIHYGPDEPDLRGIKGLVEGEDLSEAQQRRAMGNRAKLFGRVWGWFEKLNPERKPTILFAPGVPESIWFAEQFTAKGVRAAHIDGDHVWLDGELHRSSKDLRKEVLGESKTGRIIVLCNRYVLREGLDCPWLAHGILATVFGSLQSYLQSGGRLLRASPGVGAITIQDHGGCLDTLTEVLTKRGWIGHEEMTDEDVIGTMDLETERFVWCPNQGTIVKERDGEMKTLAAPHLDIRVTGYHSMVMRADARRGKWRTMTAEELSCRNSNWIIPTSVIEEVAPCSLSDAEIGFIGWFLTDGGMDAARVRIYQSVNSPLAHHQHIKACLDGCGFRYGVKQRSRPNPFGSGQSEEVIYSVSSGRKSPGGWDRLTKWLDKSFPLEVFDCLDSRQFGVLIHAMNLGDGLKHTTYDQKTISLAVGNIETADRIQSLAVRRGFRCNIADAGTVRILHIRESQVATVAKGDLRDAVMPIHEKVWCVQTATGTIIVRRKGKVSVVGNSWWRHGSLNADRDWDLDFTASMVYGLRADAIRCGKLPEPFTCPECRRVIFRVPCPCGWQPKTFKRSRPVITQEGELKLMTGKIFRQRTVYEKPDGPKLWEKMYYRSQTEKGDRTFRAAAALFARENDWQWPDKSWPLMPTEERDWYLLIRDVPAGRLT